MTASSVLAGYLADRGDERIPARLILGSIWGLCIYIGIQDGWRAGK